MIRLGLRLSFASGRWSIVPTVLAAIAVAFGTAILLFALSFQPALGVRYDHGAWRDTPGPRDPADQPAGATLVSLTHDFVEDRPLTRVDVAPLGPSAPVPPGLARLPGEGEAFVSPALAELLAARPANELADRFGRVVGTIGDAGLTAPDELAVVDGQAPAALRAWGARAVTAFDMTGEPPSFDFIINLIVVIAVVGAIAPVAVFVATATRLAAARRERRLVALRLCGATPGQVAVLAAVDALLISGPGALLGIALFVFLRPAVALFPLAQLTWFPAAIAPPLDQAALVVAAVPVVGVAAAVVALRRMTISPLGVARRVRGGPPSRWRVVPVVVALGVFVGSLVLGATEFRDVAVITVAISFFGIVVGIVIAGPLLTALVGRVVAARGGPIRLLAGRHLLDDPRSSFGAVAGVVMAVFVASVFFGFVAFTRGVSGQARVPVPASSIHASVPAGQGSVADRVAASLSRQPGVTGLVVVRNGELRRSGSDTSLGRVWIADCAALLGAARIDGASCGAADVHELRVRGGVTHASTVTGYALDASDADLAGAPTQSLALRAGLSTDRLLPDGADVTGDLPDEIIDPAALPGSGRSLQPLFLLVATDGDPATIERVRTELEVAMPTSGPATGANLAAAATRIVDELGRVVSLGVVMTLVVAGCSLAVAVAGGLLDRRRSFALLRLSGVTPTNLRTVLVVEAAAPLIAVAGVSAVLGVIVGQLVLLLAVGRQVPPPDPSYVALLVGGIAGALAIVSGVLPLVGPVTALEETRFE